MGFVWFMNIIFDVIAVLILVTGFADANGAPQAVARQRRSRVE